MSNLDAITLLFQRPNEPLFTAKDNGQTVFELPPDFYTERYKSIGSSIGIRIGEDAERTIPLRSIQPPNLEFARPIQKRGPFSLFNQQHQKIAGELVQILLDTPVDDLVSMAGYIKDRVNPYLFLVSQQKKTPAIFFFKTLVLVFSMLCRLLCNIVPIRSTFRCHRLLSNSPINLSMRRYFRGPVKRLPL